MRHKEIVNPPIRLITYDIGDDNIRNKVRNKIIKIYGGVEITESTYAVASDKYPEDIYNQIKPCLKDEDRLAVFTPKTPQDTYRMSNSCISDKVKKLMKKLECDHLY